MAQRKQPDNHSVGRKRLSLSPLTLDEALAGAMATGKPPEMPKRERPAVKRRLTEKAAKPRRDSNG